jgi:hypothetical protein
LKCLPRLEAEGRTLAQGGIAGQEGHAGTHLPLERIDLADELVKLGLLDGARGIDGDQQIDLMAAQARHDEVALAARRPCA